MCAKLSVKINEFQFEIISKYTWFDLYFLSLRIMVIYYINTNEIPGELSRENMVSSHVKITCYLHTLKDHHCYGYIINHAFRSIIKLTWYLIGVYTINRTLHGRLEI